MILTLKLDIKNAINHNQAVEILQREPWFHGLELGPLKKRECKPMYDKYHENIIGEDIVEIYEEPFIKVVSIE